LEEQLALILTAINQVHKFPARLDIFIKLFGGEEVQRDGRIDHLRWYGTTGFAFLFSGLKDGGSPRPPELLSAISRADGSTYAVFRASTLPVGATFRNDDREYIVVCNETRGQLLHHRILFCALLREAVEKMGKK
jgi:hypothetical protein